jgi:serine/threonine-protein kinase
VSSGAEAERRIVGRYALYGEIASGGMATVHYGRLLGPVGFSRTVAIKRLHAHLSRDPEFVSMFLDEARLAARIRHPHVVSVLDVVAQDGELLLVMDFVQGETLNRLIRAAKRSGGIPPNIASAIIVGLLQGLHAAHEARSDRGEPLEIVHRDVSPQNVIVGIDGVAQVLDFGVAKAAGRIQETSEGQVKGKFAYMSPEQLRNQPVDRRTDIFAAAVVLWETLTGARLFNGDSHAAVMFAVVQNEVPAPSTLVRAIPRGVDAVVLKGLAKSAEQRFATAMEFALALEAALPPASTLKIQEWIRSIAGDVLQERARRVREIEHDSSISQVGVAAHTLLTPVSGVGSVTGASMSAAIAPARAEEVAEPAPSAERRSPRRGVAIAVSALLGVGVAIGAAATIGRAPAGAASTTTAVPAQAELTASAAAVAAPPAIPPATAATATASASSSATTAELAAASAASAPSAPTPAPTVRQPATNPIRRPDCANPFTIDQSGKKKPRSECL